MTRGAAEEALFESLTSEQCWSRLGRDRLGRIAFVSGDGIDVLPVNYVVLQRVVVIATSSPRIIRAATEGRSAGFEVDQHDGVAAWSVLARGRLEIGAPLGDSAWRLRSMLPTLKSTVVRLRPVELTGRLFEQA